MRAKLLQIIAAYSAIALFIGCASTRPTTAEAPPPEDTTFQRAVPDTGFKAMVVSAHFRASEIGEQVLADGGNAIDAAVATMAALNVVEPHASGLGGGGYMLYYEAATDSFYMIDYRETSPLHMDMEKYFQPEDTLRLVQRMGATSVALPGSAAGWQEMHTRFGSKTLPELFAPAISLAEDGYPITEKQAAMIMDHVDDILADSAMSKIFLKDGLPPSEGDTLRQPELAALFRFLSSTRLLNFYYPPVGDKVLNAISQKGSTLSPRDFMSYAVRDRVPLRGNYRGYEINTIAPSAAGGTILLQILKIMEGYDVKSMGFLSPEYIHTMSSAIRQARADGSRWLADPDFRTVPEDILLSQDWLDSARARISQDSVPAKVEPMDSIRVFGPGNTTHLVVADEDGNMVSITQSLNYFFGSGVMVPELGLILNNHMADFDHDSTTMNALSPGRRPISNMAATIIRKDGKPVLVIGTPGGPRIAAALAQVIIAVLDFGIPLDEALNAPRFFPAGQTLVVETRIAKETLDVLAKKGWKMARDSKLSNYFGGVHAIYYQDNMLIGAADPRRDGAPAGF